MGKMKEYYHDQIEKEMRKTELEIAEAYENEKANTINELSKNFALQNESKQKRNQKCKVEGCDLVHKRFTHYDESNVSVANDILRQMGSKNDYHGNPFNPKHLLWSWHE